MRLRTLVRRAADKSHPLIEVKGVAIDTRSRSVTRNGVEIELTPQEYCAGRAFGPASWTARDPHNDLRAPL